MVIPIVFGALVTVTKALVQGLEDLEIRGRVETIQTTALLRSAIVLRRVVETLMRLAISQAPMRNHRLSQKGVKNNYLCRHCHILQVFLSYTNNLQTIIRFLVFLLNANSLQVFQTKTNYLQVF